MKEFDANGKLLSTRPATANEREAHVDEEDRTRKGNLVARTKETGFTKLKLDEQDCLIAMLLNQIG